MSFMMHSRSVRRSAPNHAQFACVFTLVKSGVALCMAALVAGCGDGETDESTAMDMGGLSPAMGGSGQVANPAQGGASTSNSGAGGVTATGGTSSSEQPMPMDVSPGTGGSSVDSSGAGGADAMGAGGSGVEMGGAMNAMGGAEPEPPAFAPCPSDGTPCLIMPLGDSITDGLTSSGGGYRVELFRQAIGDGHDITFVGRQQNGPNGAAATIEGQPFPRNHEGYSGATISTGGNQLANRVDAALAANPPEIILLQIGTNNVYQGLPPDLPNQLESLLDQIIEGAPDALIAVAQITPLGAGAFPNNGVEEYNALIPGIVQERINAGKHLIMVDQFTRIASNPNFVQQLVPDNIHPNDTGYAIMGETWYQAIESFLP
jgi:lysophospholipase L1-like esterase